MKVSIFGLGYVGCVTAACLAQSGHDVVGLDVNPQKLDQIRRGVTPIVEKNMDTLIKDMVEQGKLRVTDDSQWAIQQTEISLICVGTPSRMNGSLDLQYMENVCREIGRGIAAKGSYHVVVVRSTVLPGVTEERVIPLLEQSSGLKAGTHFGVCMNPEFLREGNAVHDFYHPGMIVIGQIDEASGKAVAELYAMLSAPVWFTTLNTAEMIKYANNAFHALKITFANEIGVLCKAHGIDGREVMDILCRDTCLNISPAYLKPGFAYGGSCLPKDLRAVLYRAKERDLDCALLQAIPTSNQLHIQRGIEMIERTKKRKIGVLGLSFKPGTDDMRESPVVRLVEYLLGKGYEISICDEHVELGKLMGTNKAFLEREIPHIAALMCPSLDDLFAWAEVVVITHGGKSSQAILPRVQDGQILIDLAGVVQNGDEIRGAYEGICW